MSSWRLWLLWLVLLLWDAPPTDTAIGVHKKPKGAELSAWCTSGKNLNVTKIIFCKNDCEERDILVQTSGSRQTNGRFSIKHQLKRSPPKDFIDVTISNLTLSDSGRYRCKWDRPVGSSYREFMIEVIDDVNAKSKYELLLDTGEDFRKSLFFSKPGENKTFCRNSCSEDDILVSTTGNEGQNGRYRIKYEKNEDGQSEVNVTIRNVSSADSGLYKCHLDQTSRDVWIKVSPAPPGGFPATAHPSGAPPEQEPSGRPGGNPNLNRNPKPTKNLTLTLVLIPVCVAVLVTVITLTIRCMRRKRTVEASPNTCPSAGVSLMCLTDQGPGAGGTQDPQGEYDNIYPKSASENLYQDLCLKDMEPSSSEQNEIEVTVKVKMTG